MPKYPRKQQKMLKVSGVTLAKPANKVLRHFPCWSAYLLIFLFSCALYSNTLWNKYALDDSLVLTDNRFTKKGTQGLKEIFTTDMFQGFWGEKGKEIVSGGRYRPLSMATMAVEYEITRKLRHDPRALIDNKNVIIGEGDPYLAPALSHAINIILFAITTMVLYYLFFQLIPPKGNGWLFLSMPFVIAMLYAAHPIHTEAVANIKGRDELMCMLFSLLSVIAAIKYVKTQKLLYGLLGAAVYFIGLLSKENAITFFAVIPLTCLLFTQAKAKNYVVLFVLYIIPVAIFLSLRNKYTPGLGLTQNSPEILNNPLLLATTSQRWATVALTFLYYFKLLVFPVYLTHDYYFNQIPYIDTGDYRFIVSVIVVAALLVYAFTGLKKRPVAAYGILFYFITFSIASNVLFTVGVLMNERFIYISSLGFCILVAWGLLQLVNRYKVSGAIVSGVFVLVLSLYSVKTIARNFDWKDSFTLFRRDVTQSSGSAKNQAALAETLITAADADIKTLRNSNMIRTIFNDLSGGNLSDNELNAIQNLPDDSIRKLFLDSAILHLNKSISIYKSYSSAWLFLGIALTQRDHNPTEVIPVYENAGICYDAYYKLALAYNDNNNPLKAKENLFKAYSMDSTMECTYALSEVYAELNQPDSVTYWLEKARPLKAPEALDYYLIGRGFGKVANNLDKAIEYLNKAIEMNPKAELYYTDLGAAYGRAGRVDELVATMQKLIKLNPAYPDAYLYLSIFYHNQHNTELEKQYMQKYNELSEKNGRKQSAY